MRPKLAIRCSRADAAAASPLRCSGKQSRSACLFQARAASYFVEATSKSENAVI